MQKQAKPSPKAYFGDLNHDISTSGAGFNWFILETSRVNCRRRTRFFDLVHTGKAAQNWSAAKNELFPIPIEETNLQVDGTKPG
jgi:hypothetical protein